MAPGRCFVAFLIDFFLMGGVETHPVYESLKPQRVYFQSRNFHNILHWQPGRACASNNNIYFVQYKMYGQRQWKNKEDCWGIQEFFCDLTNETSDIWEPYYGRVRTTSAGIHSGWTMTRRFTPWWETKIDPPLMNITQVNGSSLVILHAPNLPYRDQKGKNEPMENYYVLVYRVFVINNSLQTGGLRAMEWMGSKDCAWPTAFVFMKFNSLKPDLKNNYGSLMKVISYAIKSFATVARVDLWRQDLDSLPRPPQAGILCRL